MQIHLLEEPRVISMFITLSTRAIARSFKNKNNLIIPTVEMIFTKPETTFDRC